MEMHKRKTNLKEENPFEDDYLLKTLVEALKIFLTIITETDQKRK